MLGWLEADFCNEKDSEIEEAKRFASDENKEATTRISETAHKT